MAFSYGGDVYGDFWNLAKDDIAANLVSSLPLSCPFLERKWLKGELVKGDVAINGKRFRRTYVARGNDDARFIPFDGTLKNRNVDLTEVTEVDIKALEHSYSLLDIPRAINERNSIADLLTINETALKEGLQVLFARQTYMHGINSYQFNGMKYMISDNPFDNRLVVQGLLRGGMPGDGAEFWRNRVGAYTQAKSPFRSGQTKDDYAKSCEDFVKHLDNFLTIMNGKGDQKINAIYMSRSFYNLYKDWFRIKMQVSNVKEQKTDAGFPQLEYEGIPLLVDPWIPGHRIYFLHEEDIELLYLPGWAFKRMRDRPTNQLSENWRVIFVGNFCIRRAKTQGVLWVSQNATQDLIISGVPGSTDFNASPVAKFMPAGGFDVLKQNLCCDNLTRDYIDYSYDTSIYAQDIAVEDGQGDRSIEKVGYSGLGTYRADQSMGSSDFTGAAAKAKATDNTVKTYYDESQLAAIVAQAIQDKENDEQKR